MSSRIDVSIEHKGAPQADETKHPNTCPKCDSHYRDDELDASLWVCPHCGHHFAVGARKRIEQLVDEGSFVEEASELGHIMFTVYRAEDGHHGEQANDPDRRRAD